MSNLFLLILIAVLVLTCVALGFATFSLLRWKVSFEGKEITALPSDHLDKIYGALKTLSKSVSNSSNQVAASSENAVDAQAKVFERVQALLKAVSETRAEFRTLRSELDAKAQELERYRDGYDLRIVKQALSPILASHSLVVNELAEPSMTAEHRRFAELVNDSYEAILDAFGIRIETPSVGTPFTDLAGTKLPPATVRAPTPDVIGAVAEVKSPRYLLDYDGKAITMRESQVVVFVEPPATQEN